MEINPLTWSSFKNKIENKTYILCFTDNNYIIKFPGIICNLLKFPGDISGSSNYDKKVQILNSEITDLNPDSVTWTEAKINLPPLDVFFSSMGISPYSTLQISNYVTSPESSKLNKGYTMLETSYVISGSSGVGGVGGGGGGNNNSKKINRLFLSIDSDGLDITIQTSKVVNLKFCVSKIPVSGFKIFVNESEMYDAFFTLFVTSNINRFYFYGIMTQKKILEIVKKYKIKSPISKIPWLPPIIYEKKCSNSVYGEVIVEKLKLLGIEQIDLHKFMKKFYPNLSSYDLNTINNFYVGARTNNISEMLCKLCEELKVDFIMERMSDLCGVINEDLLDSSDTKLVSKMMFKIDPTTLFGKLNIKTPKTKYPSSGLYSDVYVYDYSELYLTVIEARESKEVKGTKDNFNLSELISNSPTPPDFISSLYHSSFIEGKGDIDQLEEMMKRDDVFEIGSGTLKTIGENSASWIKKITHYSQYLILSHDSYIIQDDFGQITFYGLSELCNPSFPVAKSYILDFLKYLFSLDECENDGGGSREGKENRREEPNIPEVKEIIEGLINNEYLQTINGIQSINIYKGLPLDRTWYRKKLLYYREMMLPFLP